MPIFNVRVVLVLRDLKSLNIMSLRYGLPTVKDRIVSSTTMNQDKSDVLLQTDRIAILTNMVEFREQHGQEINNVLLKHFKI